MFKQQLNKLQNMHQIHPAVPLDNWLKEKHGRFQGKVLGSTRNHQQQNNQRSKDLLSYDPGKSCVL